VVKNVTGFDLPKLLTGSHGTLAILTEITIKILPAAESSHTLVALGLDDLAAIQLLSRLLAGPFEISGAAHLPASVAARAGLDAVAGTSATLVRLEGFGPSVTERRFALEARIGAQHGIHTPDEQAADRLWRVVRDVAALLPDGHVVWRLSLPATDSVAAVTAISRHIPDDAGPVEAYYDWGGSLVWLALPPADDAHASLVRASLPSGHATLMRASPAARAQVPVFQPQQAALAALAGRVKAAFDPHGVLAPRFMGEGA
jgi:glycolate oxidase FAD binding subunit